MRTPLGTVRQSGFGNISLASAWVGGGGSQVEDPAIRGRYVALDELGWTSMLPG
jgi:hypothetical protein